MRLISSSILDPIYWKLETTSPQTYPISNYENYQIVNPLYYPSIDDRISGDFEKRNRKVDDNEYLIYSHSIVYKVSEDLAFEEATNQIKEISNRFVPILKYHSKQPTIKNIILGSIEYEVDEIRLLPEKIKFTEDEFEPNYNFATAVDRKAIEKSTQNIYFDAPIFNELILDAISAYQQKNFRMCILNCASALETASSQKLKNTFDEIKSDEKKSDHLRVYEINAGDGIHYKDPIFKSLLKSNSFTTNLHELPLYILKKSLLNENKGLYDFADKIYSTRNSLIHSGKINPDSDKELELTQNNAKNSINAVIEILDWFNIEEEYHFEDDGLTLLPRR